MNRVELRHGPSHSPRPATQVVVSVTAEPGVRSEMDSLVVRVRGAAVGAELMERSLTTYPLGGVGEVPDPVVLAIAPAGRNPCTADACVEGTGCRSTPQAGAACEDGDPCTAGDSCSAAGVCVSGPGCADGNPCTDDVCTGGTCSFPANSNTCKDGLGCTVGDMCVGGACQSGGPMSCDDANECTADSCSAGVCNHDPLSGIPCGDWDECIIFSCEVGMCRGRPRPGGCCDAC